MRTAEQIDAIIVHRHAAGQQPYAIASHLNVPVTHVRERMRLMGIDAPLGDHTNVYRVDPMWSTDGHELRLAIWQRQHDGASLTLRGRVVR